MSTISAILPYFGSKRTLAPRIVAEMGPHSAYLEPCCGSLAVLLAKPEAPMELANDLYGSVINLARVIASDRWRELARRAARAMMHEDLFSEAKARCRETEAIVAESISDIGDEHLDAAHWFLIRSWMGRNGTTGTHESNAQMARRFTAGGGHGGMRWHGAVRSIAVWHERLCRVQFSRMDMLEMIERTEDTSKWVYYIDPPYIRKGAKYVHDFHKDDHEVLAHILNGKSEARILVSYYDEPELEDLYPRDRWTRVPMPVTKALVNQGRRDEGGRVEAPEVLLVNGESLTTGGLFA